MRSSADQIGLPKRSGYLGRLLPNRIALFGVSQRGLIQMRSLPMLVVGLLAFFCSSSTQAQEDEKSATEMEHAKAQETRWNTLSQQAGQLYQEGRYAEVVTLAREALQLAESAFRPDHPTVAQCLNHLAGLYQSLGQYEKVEPLLKRALAIWEKTLGPDHHDVALSLSNLAGLYQSQGKYGEAEPLLMRALAIRRTPWAWTILMWPYL